MNIQWRDVVGLPDADRESIEQRLQSLAAEHDDLVDVHIVAKPSTHHRHGGQEIRVSGHARGKDLVATRTRDDIGLALNEALDAFERELRKLRARHLESRGKRPATPSDTPAS